MAYTYVHQNDEPLESNMTDVAAYANLAIFVGALATVVYGIYYGFTS